MNRVLTDEDRIRRAEIIAGRRNLDLYDEDENSYEQRSTNKKRSLIIQIVVCLCIYCGLCYVKNTQNDNSKVMVDNIKNVLQYDVNMNDIYVSVKKKIESLINKDSNVEEVESSIDSESIGIGGEMNDASIIEENSVEETMSDAEYIKEKIDLIKPLEDYTITSTYGIRPSNDIVSANHKGIDLGAQSGTIIKSASDGIVTEASSNGDFGLHLIIENEDIKMIYGHCSEILVNEGDAVKIGDQIAKVGATRKSNRSASTF